MEKINLIKKHGRAFEYDGAIALSFSASGIEFYAEGGFECVLKADMCGKLGDAQIHYARYGVYCDGELLVDDRLIELEKKLEIKKPGLHRYLLIKLSESADSTMFIYELNSLEKLPEGVEAPVAKTRRIEVYGDSITCGYGVEGRLAPDEFYTTATENCTKAYAYLTAGKLDADCVLVSKSGAGIISGYDGEGKRNTINLLIPYSDKAGCSMAPFADGTMPGSIEWTDWKEPDVVVINLGTNDVSFCFPDAGFNMNNISENEKKNLCDFLGISNKQLDEAITSSEAQLFIREARCEYFYNEYKGFLHTLRKRYPKAGIVSALGIMNNQLNATVKRALVDAKAEGIGKNVYFNAFKLYDTENDGIGTDYHPSAISQEKAAEELTSFILEKKLVQ